MEPFRVWLTGVVGKYGSVESAEGAVGLPARTIRRFVAPKGRYEVTQTHVSLDIVDRAVTHEGCSFLWEIYPDWYGGGGSDRPDPQLSLGDESYEFEDWMFGSASKLKVVRVARRRRRSRDLSGHVGTLV